MTVARTVADVLAERVVFEVECIDRMYVNLYQPQGSHMPAPATPSRVILPDRSPQQHQGDNHTPRRAGAEPR